MMKSKLSMSIAGIAAIVCMGTAEAATLTYSGSIGSTLTDWSQSPSLSKFDTSLGTLNSVTLYMSGTVSGSISAYNNTAGTITNAGSVGLTSTMTATMPTGTWTLGGNASAVDGNAMQFSILPAKNWSIGTITAGQTKTFSVGTGSDEGYAFATDTSTLSLFKGAGTVNLGISATGLASSSVKAGIDVINPIIDAASSYSVVYNYTEAPPVPEPAAALLLLLGSTGILLRRRK